MCQLFETIRIIDGVPRNLSLHEERLNRSRKLLFGSTDHINLGDFISGSEKQGPNADRCRVVYGRSIRSVEFSSYTPLKIRTLKVVKSEFINYDLKYSDRSQLEQLIDRQIADDILIIKNGCVTDASFANIVFTDGVQWITPDTPLLRGTMREALILDGTIKEARITVDNLVHFSHFRLINAMLGFESPVLPISNLIFE